MRDLLPALFEIKPVLMRAFEAAKKKSKKHDKYSHDFVDVTDFRWLLKYIHIYYEIYILFDQIDGGDLNNRLDQNHFLHAKPFLEKWGVDCSDMAHLWKEVDHHHGDGSGFVLFSDFSDWAIHKHLHNDQDPDDDLSHFDDN